MGRLLIGCILDLVTQTLELNIDGVLLLICPLHSIVAELAHKDKLLEQAEVCVPAPST